MDCGGARQVARGGPEHRVHLQRERRDRRFRRGLVEQCRSAVTDILRGCPGGLLERRPEGHGLMVERGVAPRDERPAQRDLEKVANRSLVRVDRRPQRFQRVQRPGRPPPFYVEDVGLPQDGVAISLGDRPDDFVCGVDGRQQCFTRIVPDLGPAEPDEKRVDVDALPVTAEFGGGERSGARPGERVRDDRARRQARNALPDEAHPVGRGEPQPSVPADTHVGAEGHVLVACHGGSADSRGHFASNGRPTGGLPGAPCETRQPRSTACSDLRRY